MAKEFVSAIIKRDGKFLVMREVSRPQYWNFPGGKVEDSDIWKGLRPYHMALAREVMEETGMVVDGIHFAYEREVHSGGIDWTGFYYHVKASGDAWIREPTKCLEMEWVTEDQLKQLPCREGVLRVS